VIRCVRSSSVEKKGAHLRVAALRGLEEGRLAVDVGRVRHIPIE
jgi:hypothetical protein